jgi:hypothetical protein
MKFSHLVVLAFLTAAACGGSGGDDNGIVVPDPTNPVVSNINPNSGITNGGTQVTVAGSRFVGGATLTVGGVAATDVTVDSATSLVGRTGPHAAGQVEVVVRNPNGETGTLPNAFTYVAPTLQANAGGPYFTRLDQDLVVTGAASTSSPLPIAIYRWNCGQSNVFNCIRDTTTPTTDFKYRRSGTGSQGTQTLRLIVIDTAGNQSAEATAQVTVRNEY